MKITIEHSNKRHTVFGDLLYGEIFQPVGTKDLYMKCANYCGNADLACMAISGPTTPVGKIRHFSLGAHVLRAISMHVKLEDSWP